MAGDDFAETINNTIRFNNKAMRNAATDFTGIAVHEMGHIISANVSVYSVDVPLMSKRLKCKEITPEILSKSKSASSSDFDDEFIRLLKGACLCDIIPLE